MGVLGESWCFCNGGGKSEKVKVSIFSTKGPAMARILVGENISGTGFLIHRNLLLTTHVNIPSVAAAEASEVRLKDGVAAALVPHRFFISSSVLDLTIVGLDAIDGDLNSQGQLPHYLKTCSKPNLELGNVVYLLGYTDKKELTVGEGKVVIATDNLIKVSNDGVIYTPGSAGFDAHGNLAFMICDPMKIATSPNAKSNSSSSLSSSLSSKKDSPMQFGIPIPIICDWLNQHWEGSSLDELNKPKLPLIRLMSVGQRSDHSCASFSLRQVFKSTEAEIDRTPSSSNTVSKPRDYHGPISGSAANALEEETLSTNPQTATHVQGIPTPEIYESPKLTSAPIRAKEISPIQLLDINFPSRVPKATGLLQPAKGLPPHSDENYVNGLFVVNPLREEGLHRNSGPSEVGSVSVDQSAVQSSSSPIDVSEVQRNGCSSEEETMYSAETAESRNYTSPREGKFQQVGRSQSCVSYNRWGPVPRNPIEKQSSFVQGRKIYSQGATSQRSNDYFSPTVSSIMKKRGNMDQPNRTHQKAVHSAPKWNF